MQKLDKKRTHFLFTFSIIKYKIFFLIIIFLILSFPVFSYDAENISLLKSGKINYALAEWWLPDDNNNNDTEALQSALSSGAEFITISDKGSPWITDPLFLESDITVFFDRGVVIEADKNGYLKKGNKLFSAADKGNIHLYGYGAVLRMHRPDYTFHPYEESQWRHLFSFMSCRNITVKGFTLEDSGGDGIYLGSVGTKGIDNYCKNILIEDVKFSGHYRQGISVISAENLLIKNCIIENTGTHLPSAGIDFEPNNSEQRIINCIVENCIIRKNFGPGILIYLGNFKKETQAVSLIIKNNKSYTNRRPISIRKISEGKRGEIILENNLFIGFKGLDSPTTDFKVVWQ